MDNCTIAYPPIGQDYTTVELILHRVGQVIFGLTLIFSIFTNGLVIYVSLKKKSGKRLTVTYLYANISLSDLVFLLSGVTQVMIYGKTCDATCRKAIGLILTISGFVSAYTMALIAYKRYYAIAFLMKEKTLTHRILRVIFAIIIIWSFSIAATLFFTHYVQTCERNRTILEDQCTLFIYSLEALKDYPYFPLIGMIVVPLLFGSYYSLAAVYALHKTKEVGDPIDIVNTRKQQRRKLKAIFMNVTVIIAFVICWLPITLLFLMDSKDDSKMRYCKFNYNIYTISSIMMVFEFGINPVIYWYMSDDFRKDINNIFFNNRNRSCNVMLYKSVNSNTLKMYR